MIYLIINNTYNKFLTINYLSKYYIYRYKHINEQLYLHHHRLILNQSFNKRRTMSNRQDRLLKLMFYKFKTKQYSKLYNGDTQSMNERIKQDWNRFVISQKQQFLKQCQKDDQIYQTNQQDSQLSPICVLNDLSSVNMDNNRQIEQKIKQNVYQIMLQNDDHLTIIQQDMNVQLNLDDNSYMIQQHYKGDEDDDKYRYIKKSTKKQNNNYNNRDQSGIQYNQKQPSKVIQQFDQIIKKLQQLSKHKNKQINEPISIHHSVKSSQNIQNHLFQPQSPPILTKQDKLLQNQQSSSSLSPENVQRIQKQRKILRMMQIHKQQQKRPKKNNQYLKFYVFYYQKIHRMHPGMKSIDITKIIKQLWKQKKLSLKENLRANNTHSKANPDKIKLNTISGKNLFLGEKLSQNMLIEEGRLKWSRLPNETKIQWNSKAMKLRANIISNKQIGVLQTSEYKQNIKSELQIDKPIQNDRIDINVQINTQQI